MTDTAPDLTPGYPSKGPRLGPAWQKAWAVLRSNTDTDTWTDGRELAETVARETGLSVNTLVALLTRMASAGKLDRTHRTVKGSRGTRRRTHYMIKG